MIDIFTAKVPITYTERVNAEGVTVMNTSVVGYLITSNLLASMKDHRNAVANLLKR